MLRSIRSRREPSLSFRSSLGIWLTIGQTYPESEQGRRRDRLLQIGESHDRPFQE